MGKLNYKWMPCFLVLLAATPLFSAQISGSVRNVSEAGVVHVKVILQDDAGNQTIDYTDARGRFEFNNLVKGVYEVSLATRPNQMVKRPLCGKFRVGLNDAEAAHLEFRVEITGVAVDFGRPTGGSPMRMTAPKYSINGNGETFSIAMRLWNMATVTTTPDRLILTCKLDDPPENMKVEIDSISLGESYLASEGIAQFTQSSGGVIEVTVDIPTFPHLGIDGEVLVLSGRVISPNSTWLSDRNNLICFCIEHLIFMRDGIPLFAPDLDSLARPWGGCAEVATWD